MDYHLAARLPKIIMLLIIWIPAIISLFKWKNEGF